MAAKSPKTVAETTDWFEKTIVPKRTASAGFSLNRLWKGPRGVAMGNTEDPDGLCGDAAAFVVQAFYDEFDSYVTSDGYSIGVVLWRGSVFNHIANVLLGKGKTGPESYTWDKKLGAAVPVSKAAASYSSAELAKLVVLDLYYKKTKTLGDHGGTIKIAQLYSIDD